MEGFEKIYNLGSRSNRLCAKSGGHMHTWIVPCVHVHL